MIVENQATALEDYLADIIERLSIFKDIYSQIRIVQPIEKIAHSLVDYKLSSKLEVEHCCMFWETQKDCNNCISMRAYISKKTAFKIEIKDNLIYLIQAFPIQIGSQDFVIEMIKDITDEEIVLADNQEDKNIHEYVKEMNTQLITDELTGAFNRRYLEEHLPTDLYKSRVNGTSIAIIMADIDYFKSVNDTYGHVVGDCVLKKFSDLVNSSIRSSIDWMARYGGEEFLIILRNSDKSKTFEIIENIRKKIEQTEFICGDSKVKITCSFGINVVDSSIHDIDKIIESADQCLYMAKQKGRNQSIIL